MTHFGRVLLLSVALTSAGFMVSADAATPRIPLHLRNDGFGDLLIYSGDSGFAFNVDYSPGAAGGFDYVRSAWLPGRALTPARLNSDNLVDMFLYDPTTGAWAWEMNTGNGYVETLTGTWSPGWTVFAADFNADQLDDLFLYDASTGEWFQCLNNAGTGLSYSAGTAWLPGLDITVGDFNGDRQKDLFAYDPLTGTWTEHLATTSTGIGFSTRSGAWSPGWRVWPVDLNGDLSTDLFLYHPDSGVAYQCVSTGTAAVFTYHQETWSPDWQVYPADFNGDGISDIFLYAADTGAWFECLGIPGGTGFSAYLYGQWSPGWQIHVSDFDGDARSDLFLYEPASGVFFRCLSTGSGRFTYGSGTWDPGWRILSEIDRPAPTPPPAPAPTPTPTPTPTTPFLTTASTLAFGDSITKGITSVLTSLGTSSLKASVETTGYPERLRAKLRAQYPNQTITVENQGVPGEYAIDGEDRLGTLLATSKADLVIILEGVNDPNAGISISRIAQALTTMVDAALAANKKVILSTLTPVVADTNGFYKTDPADVAAINDRIRRIAAARPIVLVDMFAAFGTNGSYLSPDGLHPTDAGYQKMADTFAAAIIANFQVLR